MQCAISVLGSCLVSCGCVVLGAGVRLSLPIVGVARPWSLSLVFVFLLLWVSLFGLAMLVVLMWDASISNGCGFDWCEEAPHH